MMLIPKTIESHDQWIVSTDYSTIMGLENSLSSATGELVIAVNASQVIWYFERVKGCHGLWKGWVDSWAKSWWEVMSPIVHLIGSSIASVVGQGAQWRGTWVVAKWCPWVGKTISVGNDCIWKSICPWLDQFLDSQISQLFFRPCFFQVKVCLWQGSSLPFFPLNDWFHVFFSIDNQSIGIITPYVQDSQILVEMLDLWL